MVSRMTCALKYLHFLNPVRALKGLSACQHPWRHPWTLRTIGFERAFQNLLCWQFLGKVFILEVEIYFFAGSLYVGPLLVGHAFNPLDLNLIWIKESSSSSVSYLIVGPRSCALKTQNKKMVPKLVGWTQCLSPEQVALAFRMKQRVDGVLKSGSADRFQIETFSRTFYLHTG